MFGDAARSRIFKAPLGIPVIRTGDFSHKIFVLLGKHRFTSASAENRDPRLDL